jgi:hypothetical protein
MFIITQVINVGNTYFSIVFDNININVFLLMTLRMESPPLNHIIIMAHAPKPCVIAHKKWNTSFRYEEHKVY